MTCDDVRDLAAGFVLDALTPDEMAAVREHLAACPEAHEEIAELASALPVLAEAVPVVEPPEGLGARIRAAAEADLATRTTAASARPAPATAVEAGPATVTAFPSATERDARATRRETSAAAWLMRIAAVLAIVVLGGSTLVLRGQVQSAEAYQQSVAAVLDVAGQPGSLTAVLTAEGGGPSGLAAVSSSGELTLAMQALPATSGSQVYEAWVIASDGVPAPLGSFEVGGTGTASFASTGLPTEPGMVLALTLESGPGATAPTLPIVAAGPATAPGGAG
jgi:hypothetical protein